MKFFKQFDLYGRRIELTYQKSSRFKTYFGAIATIVFATLMTCVTLDAILREEEELVFVKSED